MAATGRRKAARKIATWCSRKDERAATMPPTASATRSKDVFADTAPANPSANPAAANRDVVSGALTRIAIDNSQNTVQRSSVRNSVEQRRYPGTSDATSVLHIATRRDWQLAAIRYVSRIEAAYSGSTASR